MLDKVKAVIFDLDGTLVDSMWMWKEIDIAYLKKFSKTLPEDLQQKIEGMSFSETAAYFKERFLLPDSIEQIKADWNKMAYDKYRNEVPLKEGVLDFLKYLKKKEIKTGIATSNSRELVEAVLDKHQVADLFDSVHTSCEVKNGKPSPDIYNLVSSDLDVEPQSCLVFEDVIQGIMAGKNAEMKVCAIYDDYTKDYDNEKRELADYYIYSFREFLGACAE